MINSATKKKGFFIFAIVHYYQFKQGSYIYSIELYFVNLQFFKWTFDVGNSFLLINSTKYKTGLFIFATVYYYQFKQGQGLIFIQLNYILYLQFFKSTFDVGKLISIV